MKNYIYYLFLILLFASCGIGESDNSYRENPKGGRVYGGTLHVNESYQYLSLYPYKITDAVSHNIANQIYEGLVRFDRRNITEVQPSIASRWEIDATGTQYTFYLKKDVFFHDDPCFPNGKGREVKAQDFKYSFQLLCTKSDDNPLFESTFKGKVKGADAFYSGEKSFLDGVIVIDDYTLQINLITPTNSFLYILAGEGGTVLAQEAVKKYGRNITVGTGPFIFKGKNSLDQLVLVSNPVYHRTDSLGNKLPFIDSLVFNFIVDKKEELEAFKRGDIHIIFELPSESISEMVEAQIADFDKKSAKYLLFRTPVMSTQYYQFNILKKPFTDLKVRQAFSYAINRKKIITDVLHSEAFGPGICGLTPPGIPDYDITQIKGYMFNSDKAKKLLAEAGYPDGKNFPKITIELNSGGGKHLAVVEEIEKQLKEVLNIDVDFIVVPFAQKLEDAKYGKIDMCRAGWVADYPTPESFLRIFSGENVPDSMNLPSFPNTIKYKNHSFDSLFQLGVSAKTPEKAYEEFLKAEQIMIDDAPVMVLWYDESLKMAHSFVKNVFFNSMNYKEFSEVYLQRESDKAAQ